MKHTLIALLLSTAASAYAATSTLVIPAAGSTPGANDSQWQSEVTLHNAGPTAVTLNLRYHTAAGPGPVKQLTLQPRSTRSEKDIALNLFGAPVSTGAITIEGDALGLSKLAVNSKTVNVSASGEFGQDVPVYRAADLLSSGETAILNAPADPVAARFNFGVFAATETQIDWVLLRKDGTIVANVPKLYRAGTQTQINNGVVTLFEKDAQINDVIYARIRNGQAIVFGSAIDNRTGDPIFVESSRTRENLTVALLGVDLDENGSIDIADANGDGTLDEPVEVLIGPFPQYFKVVAADPEGSPITYSLVDASRDVVLNDNEGTVQWFPAADLRGTETILKVKVSDGTDSTTFLIPIRFR